MGLLGPADLPHDPAAENIEELFGVFLQIVRIMQGIAQHILRHPLEEEALGAENQPRVIGPLNGCVYRAQIPFGMGRGFADLQIDLGHLLGDPHSYAVDQSLDPLRRNDV